MELTKEIFLLPTQSMGGIGCQGGWQFKDVGHGGGPLLTFFFDNVWYLDFWRAIRHNQNMHPYGIEYALFVFAIIIAIGLLYIWQNKKILPDC